MQHKTHTGPALALAGLLGLALAASPARAQAGDFTFSFINDASGTAITGPQTIMGTLSGLTPGDNSGAGLTATITQAPGGDFVGDTFQFVSTYSPQAFTVSPDGMSVTFANAEFEDASSDMLYFGSDAGGSDTNVPELTGLSGGTVVSFDNLTTPDTFVFAPSSVPEPSSVAAFAFGGLGLLGLVVRVRRRQNA